MASLLIIWLTSDVCVLYCVSLSDREEGRQWVYPGMGPDIKVLNEGKMLLDTHMFAAHKLIQKQFHLDGCQSTLLCQKKKDFLLFMEETKIQAHIYTFILHLPNAWKLWCAHDRMWCVHQWFHFKFVGLRAKCPKSGLSLQYVVSFNFAVYFKLFLYLGLVITVTGAFYFLTIRLLCCTAVELIFDFIH